MTEVKELFTELINNKQTITFCIDYSSTLYFYCNEYISYSYNVSNTLYVDYITLDRAIEILEEAGNDNKYIKITTTLMYREYNAYGKHIQRILESIKDYYFAYNIKVRVKVSY